MEAPGTTTDSSDTPPPCDESSKGYASPRIFRQMLGVAMEDTSIHGLNHIWNNRHNPLVVIWLLIFSSSLLGLIFASDSNLREFFDRKVHSQTELRLSAELPLPSVAICNKVFFSKRKLEDLKIDKKTFSALMAMTTAPVGMNFNKLRSASADVEIREADENIKRVLNSFNLTFKELVERVSYSCEELVMGCSVNQKFSTGVECCRKMIAMPTMSGLCHTYYTTKEDLQDFIGDVNGLTFYITVPQDDTPDIIPDFLEMASIMKRGIQVTPISRTAHPSWLVTGNGVLVMPSSITSLELSAIEKDREKEKVAYLDQSIEPCLKEDEVTYKNNKTLFWSTYANCYYWVFSECSSKLCQCSVYGSDPIDGHPFCTLQEIVNCFESIGTFEHQQLTNERHQSFHSCLSEAMPKCRTICREVTFKYSATKTVYTHLHIHEKLDVQNYEERPAVVNIYYGNFDFAHIRFWRDEISVILSKQGGLMGFFLGCSVISILEIVIFSILITIACFRSLIGKFTRQYSRLNTEDLREDERATLLELKGCHREKCSGNVY